MRRAAARGGLFVLVFMVFLMGMTSVAHAYWTVKGRVIDASTGLPVTGVRYRVYAYEPFARNLVLQASGVVRSDGTFAGSVYGTRPWAVVHIGNSGLYYGQWAKGVATPDGYLERESTTLALSGSAARATRYDAGSIGDIKLLPRPRPYGVITGRAYDLYSGNAYWNPRIVVWKYDPGTSTWKPHDTGEIEVGDDGRYALQGQPGLSLTEPFRLSIKSYDGAVESFFPYGGSVDEAPTLQLQENEVLSAVDLAVPLPNRLTGTVMRAETKSPVSDAWLYYYEGSSLPRLFDDPDGDTSSSGKFCSRILDPGTYRIHVWDRWGTKDALFYGQARSFANARTVTLAQGDVLTGLDVWLSDVSAIAGTVIGDDSARIPDVRVTAIAQAVDGSWREAGTDYSDASGRYRVLVPPGVYTVRYTDCAGTSSTEDDRSFYLGGYEYVDDAVTVTVAASRARAISPFKLSVPEEARTERLYGLSTYASAIDVCEQTFPDEEATCAVITSGEGYAEALISAGLAGAVDGPVLLTKSKSMYLPILEELDRLGIEKVYIVGSTSVVSLSQSQLLEALGYDVERISGSNRYDLSARVMREIDSISDIDTSTPVFVVSGKSEVDGMMVGSSAYAMDAPVLLIDPSARSQSSVLSAAKALGVRKTYAVGDYEDLPTTSIATLRSNGISVSRLATSESVYSRASTFASAAETRGWLDSDTVGLASTKGLATARTSAVALGSEGGPLFFSSSTTLTTTTRHAIDQRADDIENVQVFAKTSELGSKVLIGVMAR